MKKAKNYLIDLGLKENDADVYLSCLQKPMGLYVHEIASVTDIKRSSIDLILSRLRKQGYITRHKQGARWIYCAEPLEKLSHKIEEKVKDFKTFIPSFLELLDNSNTPNVRFYEGEKGISSIFDDVLMTCGRLDSTNNELLIISSGRDLIKLLPDHQNRFIQKRIRKGIPVKILAPENNITQRLYSTSKRHIRQTKFFSEAYYPFQIEIDIYGDKVAMISFSDPGIMGTVIENKAIANSLRSLFRMLWT